MDADFFKLFENNRKFVEHWETVEPGYFEKLSKIQSPKYLWIGCSDSRVPANQITGLSPGEVFVHRNIANLVVHTDINCLSVIQYAVKVLKVEHILVVGHYGCGGIKAALDKNRYGLIDNWLRHIKDVYRIYEDIFDTIEDPEERENYLCELSVKEQVRNVCTTDVVQSAWEKGADLQIHGLVFDINDGILRNLGVTITKASQLDTIYQYKKRNVK